MRSTLVLAAVLVVSTAVRAAPAVPAADLTDIDVAFGADDVVRADVGAAALTRATAAAACYASRPEAAGKRAIAMVVVDRKGRTTRVTVAGTGDPALDRCFERAIKPATWPASTHGGAIVLRIELTTEQASGTATVDKPDEASIRVDTAPPVEEYPQRMLATVAASTGAIKRCWRKLGDAARAKDWSGVTFTIDAGGAVTAVTARLGYGAAIDTCIAAAFRKIKFPAPGTEARFTVLGPEAF